MIGGLHAVQGCIDRGDHRHSSHVIEAVVIKMISEPGIEPYLRRVRRSLPPLLVSLYHLPRVGRGRRAESISGFSQRLWASTPLEAVTTKDK